MSISNQSQSGAPVYIVDGARTPFLKARGKPGPFAASDLATQCARTLLARQPFEPGKLDEVVLGCAMPSVDEANIGRILALRAGCGMHVPGWTVMRNCASAMQAIDSAAKGIALGRSDMALAGGTESMSHAPVLYGEKMVEWLAALNAAKTPVQKARAVASLKPSQFAPVIGLLRGLTDPVVGLNMGQTCEIIANRFGITREQMDAYAARSHARLAAAYDDNRMDEVVPLYGDDGKVYEADDGFRRDSTPENLAKLKPWFDKHVGLVTAANSSQITDGAALLVLASEAAVERHGLTVLGRIVDTQWAALDPAEMGLGPVHAATPILRRHRLGLNDIDNWEINEAFAGQVLACRSAWADADYCRDQLGIDGAVGELDMDRLNVDGGAIAAGHPVGTSGARIVLHSLKVLQRTGGRLGMAAICIGGGQGGAMLLERIEETDRWRTQWQTMQTKPATTGTGPLR